MVFWSLKPALRAFRGPAPAAYARRPARRAAAELRALPLRARRHGERSRSQLHVKYTDKENLSILVEITPVS